MVSPLWRHGWLRVAKLQEMGSRKLGSGEACFGSSWSLSCADPTVHIRMRQRFSAKSFSAVFMSALKVLFLCYICHIWGCESEKTKTLTFPQEYPCNTKSKSRFCGQTQSAVKAKQLGDFPPDRQETGRTVRTHKVEISKRNQLELIRSSTLILKVTLPSEAMWSVAWPKNRSQIWKQCNWYGWR